MARVRSTARVTCDGEEAKTAETMKRSGLVVSEDVSDEGAPATEAEQVGAE
jgi:hypothetical protein